MKTTVYFIEHYSAQGPAHTHAQTQHDARMSSAAPLVCNVNGSFCTDDTYLKAVIRESERKPVHKPLPALRMREMHRDRDEKQKSENQMILRCKLIMTC